MASQCCLWTRFDRNFAPRKRAYWCPLLRHAYEQKKIRVSRTRRRPELRSRNSQRHLLVSSLRYSNSLSDIERTMDLPFSTVNGPKSNLPRDAMAHAIFSNEGDFFFSELCNPFWLGRGFFVTFWTLGIHENGRFTCLLCIHKSSSVPFAIVFCK